MMRMHRLLVGVLLAGLMMLGSALVRANALPDFTALVETHSAAVVNISTTQKRNPSARGRTPFSEEDLQRMPDIFRHFFGAPPGGLGGPQGPDERQSMGSGFIVSADGYILTNNHVIDGADRIIVRLNDRRELEARLVGADPRSDMAVLKVEAKDLPVLQLGRSDALKVGEWVVAIGSPFGFDYSVTAGIVSAIGRSLPNENYVPFIQTDVAINPGNSGGPLFNMRGEVVGINSQIYTRSGGFMGVSFAIPIDVAMEVFAQIKDKGFVSRGWLGVLIQEVSRDLAESFGLDKPQGALVAEVVADSPAEKAGLKAGDVIVSFNGQAIARSAELPPLVGRVPAGGTAELDVVREGQRQRIQVTIAELPDDGQAQAAPGGGAAAPSNLLGVTVEALTEQQLKEAGIDSGVLITGVSEGPGRVAGLQPGDILRRLNNQALRSVADFEKALAGLPRDKAIPMLVVRQGNPSFMVIKIPSE